MTQDQSCCAICATGDPSLVPFQDAADVHLLCPDCLEAVTARQFNPARWQAFVVKHGDGSRWFEHLPLPAQALNKLQCK